MLAAGAAVTAYAVNSQPDTYSFFASTDVSGVSVDPDSRQVELGLKFVSKSAGTLEAVRFLKARGDRSAHRVTVWSADGDKLATATPRSETRSGWQQVKLAKPLDIEPGVQYVVSYNTTRYSASQRYFAGRTAKAGPLATVGSGVYDYGSGDFPEQSWQSSNYWVDVVFATEKDDEPAPAPTTAPTTTAPAPAPSATTATPEPTRTTAPPAGGSVLDLPRVAWEGGPSYYSKFAKGNEAEWDDPSFFPIGVWYEGTYSQAEIDKDKDAGLNTYVMLTEGSDMKLIERNGMHAMTEGRKDSGGETTGWIINDEVDMWGGAGNSTWTGKYPGQGEPCTSGKYDCGFDIMKRLSDGLPKNDGRMTYANFGKGVVFWQSDADASRFVNDYTTVVSNDIYWYTDPNVCYSSSEGPSLGVTKENCRRAANYGITMDVMRRLDGLDGKRQPVYAFVEVGKPFPEASAPTITADQIGGAVVNSLIHEARGVLYFNHNFGGPCISQHVLRDACGTAVRPAVSELNRRITSLAPVLNTQSYQWKFNPQLDTMLKERDGSYYIFAMPGRTGGTGEQKLTMPAGLGGAKAEVMFENRSVPVVGGTITDNFAKEFSYHIYKITP
ncbi:DUF4082 domain-containing protein [Actinoplanes sp. NPDC051633]|uniref:DUF4082 domain-containing protein n=1 Tax=Actinoplanes sp. NPDC051633 TaxID=3155670 RepID=UPI00342056AA